MLKLKISHKGKIYKYLITSGGGKRIYGRGKDRLMIDPQGKRSAQYSMSGGEARWF